VNTATIDGNGTNLQRPADKAWDLTPEQRTELKARVADADRGELLPAAEVFAPTPRNRTAYP
jgi:hypothetical protein